jgi:hypothetical protein
MVTLGPMAQATLVTIMTTFNMSSSYFHKEMFHYFGDYLMMKLTYFRVRDSMCDELVGYIMKQPF